MNETSASVPRAERKHTPRLTWRAWVARALLFVLATGFVRMAYDGYVATTIPHSHATAYSVVATSVFSVLVVGLGFAVIVACVTLLQHINERK